MRFLWFLMLGLSASVAFAQPNDTQPTVVNPLNARVARPTDPKAQIATDLGGFLNALNDLKKGEMPDNGSISDYLSGGRVGFFGGSEWADYFVRERGQTQYRLEKIEFKNLTGDTARMQVFYSLLSPPFLAPAVGQPAPQPKVIVQKRSETLELKREIMPWGDKTEKWRIVAPSPEDASPLSPFSLRSIAFFGGQRANTLPLLRAQISEQNLKQAALGVLQFVQDYDEQYLFNNEFWREAIQPYVKSQAIFQIPGTHDFYTFNDNLSDKSIAAVNEIARTVLFYEGEDEKPTFRYSGKAAIAFADGHIALVSPEEAQKLIWKP